MALGNFGSAKMQQEGMVLKKYCMEEQQAGITPTQVKEWEDGK
jgi:hypothetical protein